MSLATGESKKNGSKTSWLPLSWGTQFTIAVTGSALAWLCQIFLINGRAISAEQFNQFWFTAPFLLSSLICITFPIWTLALLWELSKRRGKSSGITGFLFFTVFSLLFINIFPGQWVFLAAFLGLPLIYFLILQRLKHRAYDLSRRGEFDKALDTNRRFSHLPGYGSSLEGVILFNAGRYADAGAFVKSKAFDERGNPLLTSTEFYIYALSLINSGHEAEAEKLLREAVQAPQCKDSMKVALAACLLTQCKEPDYACKLMEEVMAAPQRPITAYGERGDRARRVAQYGWALASCGNRQEMEARIQEAFAVADGLNGSDLAGVHYFVGEAWRALGETAKARVEFNEALALSPEGVTALSAKKALAKMDGRWRA